MRTRVEIVIVILILLACGGVFAPVVSQGRQAAARTQCISNLKQLGIAVYNYHETYSKYPRAALPNAELPEEKRQSWVVEIWPFVEAGPLYSKMDHQKAWDAEENRFAALTVIRILQCPSYPERPRVNTFFPTHYLGISGIGADAIHLPLKDKRAGFFGYDRELGKDDLTRSTSSILMVAETSEASGAWTAAGAPTTRGLDPDGPPYSGRGGQFGGNHRDGTTAALADCSVTLIAPSVAPSVWEAMATLRGHGNPE